jgi:hypothetical protein
MLRDEQRRVRATMAKVLPTVTDPTVADALALWKAITFCRDLGYSQVVFEGDACRWCSL